MLRFFQGLSLAETAEVMGRNAGAVKALQHRAMRRLHILLSSPPSAPLIDGTDDTAHPVSSRSRPGRAPPPVGM